MFCIEVKCENLNLEIVQGETKRMHGLLMLPRKLDRNITVKLLSQCVTELQN